MFPGAPAQDPVAVTVCDPVAFGRAAACRLQCRSREHGTEAHPQEPATVDDGPGSILFLGGSLAI